MTSEEWITDQIEVTVSGVFTTQHYLETPAGIIGEFTVPAMSMTSVFRGADGRELIAEQTSWWKQEHELRDADTVLGAAWPRGFFHREIEIEFGGQQYILEPVSMWRRNWQLIDPTGTALIEIEPRGAFRRGAFLTILGELPTELLVFAYYLIQKRWQTDAAAASAAAAGGS